MQTNINVLWINVHLYLVRVKTRSFDNSAIPLSLTKTGRTWASWSSLRNPAPAISFQRLWIQRREYVFLTTVWQLLDLKKLEISQWYSREFNSLIQRCWILIWFSRGQNIFWTRLWKKPFGKRLGRNIWRKIKSRMISEIDFGVSLDIVDFCCKIVICIVATCM